MHNRLRMLWGKAVLQWTPDAETCLRIDRPFYPRPIYGTVRYLSLKAEAKRRQGKR